MDKPARQVVAAGYDAAFVLADMTQLAPRTGSVDAVACRCD